MEFSHKTVLLDEAVRLLHIKPDGIYLDGTLGGGGHSEAILEQLTTGTLIGVDQDTDALAAASKRLERFGERFVPVHSNFSDVKNVLKDLELDGIDGAILDLGVSSYQLDEGERGFSYMQDGPLDMRMDRTRTLSAAVVLNDYSEDHIYKIIRDYGEEKWAKRIAAFIVASRAEKPIETTEELVRIIKQAVPAKARQDGPHPAKRTFQAIRIEVNNELGVLETALADFVQCMNPGGRLGIITFHSLEDRIVKQTFREMARSCVCPPELPVCMCNTVPLVRVITRKAIEPSALEVEENPRARSARLRGAEKI